MSLNIIYFVWINEKKNYKKIIEGQLDDMINSGIMKVSNLYIECVCENKLLITEINNTFTKKLINIKYNLEIHHTNHYEYYGIKKMYDLACEQPNSYFLYFHSKGMFNYDNMNNRHIYELTLTKGTLYLFEEVLNTFNKNQNIMKIGLFPAINDDNQNFIWFNFYYARGAYLITCEKPIISTNRFYYEIWSETGNNQLGLIYNLYEKNFKKYELSEAGNILNRLNGGFIR